MTGVPKNRQTHHNEPRPHFTPDAMIKTSARIPVGFRPKRGDPAQRACLEMAVRKTEARMAPNQLFSPNRQYFCVAVDA
eukprot:11172088-Lingulodinium_polyedra.AAC.1